MDDPRDIARQRAAAEQRVRDRVMLDTYKDLTAQPLGDRLAASHYAQLGSVSGLAIAARQRKP
ncbi:hypothetical protein [Mesorhizobium sp. B1-1-7]|uniref:hypothetical protein n=1 Tax=Mesorhizobium sp. B1-1-7 TaxID=2589977 RepID=UPI00112B403B|nr:hypothetical protein [Mesorhizobium sp. B1-1-7]TPN57150.1 hypothetical protein FJ978_00570 [Mesorhizobium sp. B1-1-7]